MITLLIFLVIAMAPMWVLGTYIFVKIFIIPNSPPADRTNRINHLRAVFFSLQSPEKLIAFYPWIGRDEQENLKDN